MRDWARDTVATPCAANKAKQAVRMHERRVVQGTESRDAREHSVPSRCGPSSSSCAASPRRPAYCSRSLTHSHTGLLQPVLLFHFFPTLHFFFFFFFFSFFSSSSLDLLSSPSLHPAISLLLLSHSRTPSRTPPPPRHRISSITPPLSPRLLALLRTILLDLLLVLIPQHS